MRRAWMDRRILLSVVLGGALGFVYGVGVGARHYPPYETIRVLWHVVTPGSAPREKAPAPRPAPPIRLSEGEVDALITVRTAEDVREKRRELHELIWGEQGMPGRLSLTVDAEDVEDPDFADMEGLARIDRLLVRQPHGIDSVAYHFHPNESRDVLVVYHQGHRGHFRHGAETISALVADGYAVIAMAMPLLGPNPTPVVDNERFGSLQIRAHNFIPYAEPPSGHSVQFFLSPVAAVVDYAREQGYERIAMVGLSGGGWTTTVYAALDERVGRSYPVAGSLPLYLRTDYADPGDWEQYAPEVYQVANYLELYVLGAHGQDRAQLQLINVHDPCCFWGEAYRSYADVVGDVVRGTGAGSFRAHGDDTHREHRISSAAMSLILEDLSSWGRNDRPAGERR